MLGDNKVELTILSRGLTSSTFSLKLEDINGEPTVPYWQPAW